MRFKFNYAEIEDSINGKMAKEIFDNSFKVLNDKPIDNNEINQIQFSYNYCSNKGATITIIFEVVAKKLRLTTDHISYSKTIKDFQLSQKIFEIIVSVVESSGYEINKKEFVSKDSLPPKKVKKSVQIRPKIKE